MFCVCDDGDGDDDENGGGNDHIGRSILGDKNYSDMAVNTIRCVQVLFQIILLVWLCHVLHKCVFSANNFVDSFTYFHSKIIFTVSSIGSL